MNEINNIPISQTEKIKGFLIILIVIGHTKHLIDGALYGLLYSFHVSLFFMFMFLFNNKTFNKGNLLYITKKIMVPYSIAFLFSLIIYHLIFNSIVDISLICKSFLYGYASQLRNAIGYGSLWFLPTYFSLSVLLMIYNSIDRYKRIVFILFAILLHFFIATIDKKLLMLFPFGLSISFFLFGLGLIVKIFVIKILEIIQNRNFFSIILIIFISILMFVYYGKVYSIGEMLFPAGFDIFLFDCINIFMFILLLIIKLPNFLIYFGKNSLFIYLIHPFFNQGFYILFKNLGLLYYSYDVLRIFLVLFFTILTIELGKKISVDKIIKFK